MTNPNFSALVSTTLKNYRKNLSDNIMGHQALLWKLKSMGYVREEDGGTTIVEPLLVARNSTVKSYNGYDVLDLTPQEGITAAEYDWKQIAGSLSISGREKFINSGSKTKILSLLESKTKQLEESMSLEVNRQLQLDGTGNASKDLTGLSILVEDGAAWSTVGGIDSNANTYWRNQFTDLGGSFAALGLDAMRTLYNSASRQGMNESPDLIISTQGVYEAYEKTLTVNERFMDTAVGDAGFMNLMYKKTPMCFDEDIPLALDGTGSTHAMYMLNSKYLAFVVGKGKNFVTTPSQKPENQDAEVSQILLYANLVTSNRARQALLDGIVLP